MKKQRREESEKRRDEKEKRRDEKEKRKSQKKEDAGVRKGRTVANHCFSDLAPEGGKVGSLKR